MSLISVTAPVTAALARVASAVNDLILGFTKLGSTTAGQGASQVGISDADGRITATEVEAAVRELATRVGSQLVTCTMAVGAEASQAIPVTINTVDLFAVPVSKIQKYLASVYFPTMILGTAAAFRLSETGVGAEVSTTANSQLIFTTDANGDATLSVLDQTGSYAGTAFLIVTPISDSAEVMPGMSRVQVLTFA